MEELRPLSCFAIAFFCLPLFFATLSLQDTLLSPLYIDCLRNATHSSVASSGDLDTALLNFTSLSAQGSSYAAASSGTLHAMFQCRGDLSAELCSACVQNATALLPLACPQAVGARVRLEGCFLRYDNQSFFHLDTSYVKGLCNVANTSDSLVLTAISDVMLNVTNKAPVRSQRFASAAEHDVFAMAECWRYLNESECLQCLETHTYLTICDSKVGAQLHLASCDYRYEEYEFLEVTSSPSQSPAPSPGPPAAAVAHALPISTKSGSGRKTWILGVIICVSILIVFLAALGAVLMWRRGISKHKGVKRVDGAGSSQKFLRMARVFSLEELEQATGNFDSKNKLGEGGFGVVYKGTLFNGDKVAIKKLKTESQQGTEEFLNEVNFITNVQHKNLIRLLGCCVEGPERILVYEYLANKSLELFLSAGRGRTLTWSNRFGIIIGMAKGLAYLHEESQIRIIHRDIKPSNILLDDQLNPIITDFGLARLVQDNVTHINTSRVAGTMGYMPPEYAAHGVLSDKVDVYGFGMVALEIVTGKQNKPSELLTWVWQNYEHGDVLGLVDNKMAGIFSLDQVVRVVHIALLCTQENPKKRPTMSMVTLLLSGTSDILEIPIKPSFIDYNHVPVPLPELNQNAIFTSSTSSHSSDRVYPVAR